MQLDKTNFDDAMNTAKEYTTKSHNELDPSALIYLFGSVVHGNVHSRSDIDVGVVSETFTNDVAENYTKANHLDIWLNLGMKAQTISYDDWQSSTPLT